MMNRAAMLDALLADPRQASRVSPADAARLIAEIAAIALALAPRLTSPVATADAAGEGDGVLLTVDDVQRLTGYSRRRIYALADQPGWRDFALKQGRKTLRFRPGLRAFLAIPKPRPRVNGIDGLTP